LNCLVSLGADGIEKKMYSTLIRGTSPKINNTA